VRPDQPTGRFDGDSGEFVLTERWHCELSGCILEIDPGFASDGASIPKWLQSGLSPRYEAATFPAALAHDALYLGELVNRKSADYEFYLLLKLLDVPAWKAKLYYRAVRLFGWWIWKKHRPEQIKEARKLCRLRLKAYPYAS
jgi:hypothetical protein